MKRLNLWFRCAMAGILISLLAAAELHGCTMSLAEVNVPPSFGVSVLHGERDPVAGIPVAVYDVNDPRPADRQTSFLTLLTGKDGRVEIKDLRVGRYIIQTEGPGRGSAVYAVVSAGHEQLKKDILLRWPFSWRETLKVRTLAGELASNNPWMPFDNVHLELWTAGVTAPLAAQDTGPEGRFNFNITRAGIYILRIQGQQKGVNPNNQVGGELPIELSSSASEAKDVLSLRLEMSTCGLEYSNCRLSNDAPITTAARHFQVLYGPGVSGEYPWISNVRFKLLDNHGASIAEGRTDSKGMAALPPEFAGRATLVVADWGLTSLRQALDLLPADEGAPSLVVRLGHLSETNCSSVNVDKHAP